MCIKINILKMVFLISATMLFSCTKSNIIELPQELNNLNRIEHEVSFNITPLKLIYHKGKLITTNIYSKEDRFTVFGTQPFKQLYTFGSIGRSASEFLHTFSILSDNYMEVMNMHEIKCVDLQDSSAKVSSTKKIPTEALNNFGKMNDSTYFTSDKRTLNDDYELLLFCTKSNDIRKIGKRPKWGANNEVSTFSACYNKRLNRFALFYGAYPELKIMDSDGKNIRRFEIKVDKKADPINNLSVYFINAHSTDKYIYIYWVNRDMNNVNEMKDTNLLVFDWDGNIKRNYMLEGLHNFYTVSDDDKKLYTLAYKRDSIINEFDLPEIK